MIAIQMLRLNKNDCHSERSEEPPYFVFAVARSLPLYTFSEFALEAARRSPKDLAAPNSAHRAN
jgi:hypothetical protein